MFPQKEQHRPHFRFQFKSSVYRARVGVEIKQAGLEAPLVQCFEIVMFLPPASPFLTIFSYWLLEYNWRLVTSAKKKAAAMLKASSTSEFAFFIKSYKEKYFAVAS